MQEVANNNGKIKAVPAGKITVDEIKDGYKGREAQIRQEFKKSYPSMQASNEFKDSLFSNDELGIEETDHIETRVTWIPVGKKHKPKDVEAALAEVPAACIYRVLSFEPIIPMGTKNVLANGLTGDAFENFITENNLDKEEWDAECSKILLNKIAARQLVVYGENNKDGKDADEAVLYKGMKQYREVYFSLTPREDVDYRVDEKQDIPALVLSSEEVEEKVKA